MAQSIRPERLAEALADRLGTYHSDIVRKIDAAGEESVKTLVAKTKKTAPKRTGGFRKAIAWQKTSSSKFGSTYSWYVKAPHYRRTHLLVHGHAKKKGGRVAGDPFLHNALDQVLPAYEEAVKEALKND